MRARLYLQKIDFNKTYYGYMFAIGDKNIK